MALEIEIDVSKAQQSLTQFRASLEGLGGDVDKAVNRASKSIERFEQAIAKVKPIPTATVDSFKALGDATRSLGDISNLRGLSLAIERIVKLDMSRVASQFEALSKALLKIVPPPGLANLATQLNALTNAANKAASASVNVDKSLRKLDDGARRTASSMGGLNNVFGSLNGILAGFGVALGAVGFSNFISGALEAVTAFDALANTVKAAEGSMGDVGSALDFVKGVAKSTATDIGALASSFGKFNAAVIFSGQSAETARTIFQKVSETARVLKLSADRTGLAFLALEQMFSKGSVSMEELRRQFGEQIPGAFQIFADSMKVSGAELTKLLKEGKVGIDRILPFIELLSAKFAAGLPSAMKSAQAAMQNFANAGFLLREAFGRTFFDAFKEELNSLADALGSDTAIENFARFGDILGNVVGAAISVIKGFTNAINGAMVVVNLFVSILELIPAAFDTMTEAMGLGAQAANVLSNSFEFLGTLFGTAGIAVGVIALAKSLGLLPVAFGAAAAGAGKLQKAFALLTANPWVALLTGIAAAVAFVTVKFLEWKSAQDELMASLQPTVDNLTAIDPKLKELRDSMADLAEQTGMSAEKASEFADAMVKAAAPQDVMDAAIEKNIQSLEKMQKAMQNANEVLGQRVTLLIANAMADGTLSAAEQSMINDAIKLLETVEASNKGLQDKLDIQKAMKGSTESLTREQQKNVEVIKKQVDANRDGVVSSEEVKKSLEGVRREGGLLNDVMNFLGDTFGRSSADGEKLSSAMTGVEGKLNAIKPVATAAAGGTDQLGKALSAASEESGSLSDTVGNVLSSLGSLANTLLGISPAAAETATGMGKAADGATKLGTAAGDVSTEASTAADNMNTLAGSAGDVGKKLDDVAKGDTSTNLGNTATAAQTLADNINNLLTPLTNLVTNLDGVAAQLQGVFNVAATGQSQLMSVANAIGFITAAVTPLQSAIPLAQESFTQLGTAAAQIVPLIQPVADQMTSMSTNATSLTTSLPMVAQSFGLLMSVLQQVAGIIGSVVTSFQSLNTATAAVTQLQETITALGAAVQPAQAAADGLAVAMAKLGEAATNAIGGLRALEGGLESAIAGMERTGDAADKLAEAFEKMAEAAREAGREAKKALSEGAGGGAGGGGDGGTDANAQRIGGMSTDMHSLTRVPMKSFNNAPSLAGGTANTNSFSRKLAGGGIPSILHPNEAVIPLSRGRKVPVDVQLSAPASPMGEIDLSPMKSGLADVAAGLRSLARAVAEPARVDATQLMKQPQAETEFRKPVEVKVADTPTAPPAMVEDKRSRSETLPRIDRADQSPAERNNATDNAVRRNLTINMTVNATDADSFKRTEDQIVRSLGQKIERAVRRGG